MLINLSVLSYEISEQMEEMKIVAEKMAKENTERLEAEVLFTVTMLHFCAVIDFFTSVNE